MIDEKEYYRITNCTSNLRVPIEYTPEEAQIFLQKLGYKILVHSAPVKQGYRDYDENVYYKEEVKENLYAVKSEKDLPARNDDPGAYEMGMSRVFQKEMRSRLFKMLMGEEEKHEGVLVGSDWVKRYWRYEPHMTEWSKEEVQNDFMLGYAKYYHEKHKKNKND